jgi:hypothetical protein
MKNLDIMSAFSAGPTIQGSSSGIIHKRKNRRSKLQPHAEFILKFWASGKSLQYICDRLRAKSILCHRSTVSRFLKKSVSL